MAKQIKESRWNGQPLYKCPYCPHATTDGKGAVEEHMVSSHADQLRFDHLLSEQKKAAKEKASEESTGEPTGDLPAGSAGHAPATSATKVGGQEGTK